MMKVALCKGETEVRNGEFYLSGVPVADPRFFPFKLTPCGICKFSMLKMPSFQWLSDEKVNCPDCAPVFFRNGFPEGHRIGLIYTGVEPCGDSVKSFFLTDKPEEIDFTNTTILIGHDRGWPLSLEQAKLLAANEVVKTGKFTYKEIEAMVKDEGSPGIAYALTPCWVEFTVTPFTKEAPWIQEMEKEGIKLREIFGEKSY